MKTEEAKSCRNCRYYLKHYIKKNTKYQPIQFGHCANQNNPKRTKSVEVCELWENNEIKMEERRKAIDEVLRDIEKHLSEMAMILNEDKH